MKTEAWFEAEPFFAWCAVAFYVMAALFVAEMNWEAPDRAQNRRRFPAIEQPNLNHPWVRFSSIGLVWPVAPVYLRENIGAFNRSGTSFLAAHSLVLNNASPYQSKSGEKEKRRKCGDWIRPNFFQPVLWLLIAIAGMAGVIYSLCRACDVYREGKRWRGWLTGCGGVALYFFVGFLLFFGGLCG